MRTKFSLHQTGFSSLLGIILGLALLVVVSLSLISMFGGRATETPQISSQSEVSTSQKLVRAPTIVSNQTDPTVGWKTFKDHVLGYTFKYPPNWYLQSYATGGVLITSYDPEYLSDEERVRPPSKDKLKIEIGLLTENKPLAQRLDAYINDFSGSIAKEDFMILSQTDYEISGRHVLKQVITKKQSPDFKTVSFYLESGQQIYFLTASPANSFLADNVETLLRTFQLDSP